jgi:hypothetical protein
MLAKKFQISSNQMPEYHIPKNVTLSLTVVPRGKLEVFSNEKNSKNVK